MFPLVGTSCYEWWCFSSLFDKLNIAVHFNSIQPYDRVKPGHHRFELEIFCGLSKIYKLLNNEQ